MNLFLRRASQPHQPSAEMGLLRLCARSELGQEVREDICSQVEMRIDWARASTLAHHHRVLPSLYRGLMGACPDRVPFEVLAGLRRDYQTNAAKNLWLTQELLKILGFFESHGIEAIPFKGPALAEQYYGDIALRQFDDLDVLVRERDVARVRDLLMGEGFEPEFSCVRIGDPEVLWEEGEYRFFSPEGTCLLEAHWQAVPRAFLADFKMELLWGRTTHAKLGGRPVRCLSAEDGLLVLAIHGMHHLWDRLTWIQDVARLVRGAAGLDWDGMFHRAGHVGALRMLEVALLLGHGHLYDRLPESVVEKCVRDGAAVRLARQFGASWGRPSAGDRRPAMFRQHLRARERWADKWHYLVGQLFAPSFKDWPKHRLPGRLSFLYGVVRPVRQVQEWLKAAGRAKRAAATAVSHAPLAEPIAPGEAGR